MIVSPSGAAFHRLIHFFFHYYIMQRTRSSSFPSQLWLLMDLARLRLRSSGSRARTWISACRLRVNWPRRSRCPRRWYPRGNNGHPCREPVADRQNHPRRTSGLIRFVQVLRLKNSRIARIYLARILTAGLVAGAQEYLGDEFVPTGSEEHWLAPVVAHNWYGNLEYK